MSEIEVPEGWESKKISEITRSYAGGTPSTANREFWENGTIPWLRSGKLKDSIIEFSNDFITEKGLEQSSAKLYPPGTVLIAITGATTGKTALLKIEACGTQNVFGILPCDEILPTYLWHYMKYYYKQLISKSIGGAQSHVNGTIIKKTIVNFPKDKKTQKKIVQKLDYILGQLEEKKKVILEYIKKNNHSINYIISNYHRMIISPQIPNKNFPKTWKIKKLVEIASVGQGGTPSRIKPEYWDGDIPWLRSGELRDNRIYDSNEKITKLGLEKSSTQLCPKGTILIAMTGQGLTRGRTGFLEINACANQSCTHMIIKNDEVLNEYVWLYLQSQYWNFRTIHHGSGQPGINTGLIKQLDIPIPPLPEQKRIINKIKDRESSSEIIKPNLRSILEKNNAIINSLNNLSYSVLEQAFSGRLVN